MRVIRSGAVEDIDPAAVYRSPLGKTCRLARDCDPSHPWVSLEYQSRESVWATSSTANNGNGFMLTRANFHILERIG